MKRRDFLKQGVMWGAIPAVFSGARRLTSNDLPFSIVNNGGCHAFFIGEKLLVFHNHKLMLDYRFASEQNQPSFERLAGPVSGLSLISTEEHAWNQGHSMFFSCDKVNGNHFRPGPHSEGKIISSDVAIEDCTRDAVEFTHASQWLDRKNRPMMTDARCFSVRFLSESVYTIDCVFTMTPLVDVTIAPTGHSFLGLKTASDIAPDGGGTLRNASGLEGMKNTCGQSAKWCTCFGPRRGVQDHLIEGIALLAQDTLLEPSLESTCWLTRDYGFLVPHSFHFLKKPWTRQQGETFTLRYRVVAYCGEPDEELLMM